MSGVAARVGGTVAPGFERVADVFEEELGRLGAAFAAVREGKLVVDLWGGIADADTGEPWREDTVQIVFSGTKGVVATCMLILLERGALELDAEVRTYWPEFAAAGKEHVRVRHVVSHVAGVPGLRDGFGMAELLDPERAAQRVAAEAPFWAPGSTLAYHALTYGWICGELLRRVDGRSIGRFLAEEVAEPLGLELWLGLPAEMEPRVAHLQPAEDYGITYLGDGPEPLLRAVYGDLLGGGVEWNDRPLHEVEIAGANAIGTARSLARLYGCLAAGAPDGTRLLSDDTIRLGRTELSRGVCAITRRPYAYGVGFELQTELEAFGPPRDAFGHSGSGGSRHGAWPDERVGFSYAMNELVPEERDDRSRRLLAALHDALEP